MGNMRNLVEGRPSELETEVGAIARLGRKLGVEVPRRTFLYAALLPHERKVRDGIKQQRLAPKRNRRQRLTAEPKAVRKVQSSTSG